MCTRGGYCSLKPMVEESNRAPLDCCTNDGSCCRNFPPYNKLIKLQDCCCGTNSDLPPARFFEYFYDRRARSSTLPQFTMLQNPDFTAAPRNQAHWPKYQNMTANRVSKPDAERFVRVFEFAPNYPSPIAAIMARPNECMPY